MDDELRKIEIETARIRLMREKMALEDEVAKRDRSSRISDSRQKTIDTAVEVSHLAAGASAKASKRIIQGVIVAGLWSLAILFLIVKSKNWETQHLVYNFGYYIGYGGFVPLLIAAIKGPYLWFDDKKTWGKGLLMFVIVVATIAVFGWTEKGFY